MSKYARRGSVCVYWISRSRKRGTKCYNATLRRANAMTVCLSSSSLIPILFPRRCFSFRSFEQKLRLQSAYVYYSVQQFDSHIAASYVRAGTVSTGKHPTNPLPLLGEPRVKGESTGKRDRDYLTLSIGFAHRTLVTWLLILSCFLLLPNAARRQSSSTNRTELTQLSCGQQTKTFAF